MERSADREGDPVPQILLGQSIPLKIPKEEPLVSLQNFLKIKAVKSSRDFFL